jgi:hypothetical protein
MLVTLQTNAPVFRNSGETIKALTIRGNNAIIKGFNSSQQLKMP